MIYFNIKNIIVFPIFYFALLISSCVSAHDCSPKLPQEIYKTLNTSYKDYRVLRVSDLNEEDQVIWKNSYKNICPGVVHGNFTENRKQYAVLLVPNNGDRKDFKVVLFGNQNGSSANAKEILSEKIIGNLPVIRRSGPGIYIDRESNQRISVKNDALLIEHLESKITAIVYTKNKFHLITIAD